MSLPTTAQVYKRTPYGAVNVNTGEKFRGIFVPPPVDDGFRLGIDRPDDASNRPSIPESQMRVHQGDLTLTAGMHLFGLRVTGRLNVNSADSSLSHSIVEVGVPPGGTSPTVANTWEAINVRSSSITGGLALLDRVWVRPSVRSHDTYGFRGGNFLARRCIVEGVIDAFAPNGTATARKAARIEGCLVRDLPTFRPDPRQSDGVTHNDGVQAAGAMTFLEVVGNDIEGGRTSCVLVQQNSGTYDRVTIDRNWLIGHPTEGSTLNASQNSRGPIANYTVTGNRLTRRPGRPMILVPAETLAAPTTRISGNTYLDDGSPVLASNGG